MPTYALITPISIKTSPARGGPAKSDVAVGGKKNLHPSSGVGGGRAGFGFEVSKFWAISDYLGNIASKFWQFHISWASLCQHFGQFYIYQTISFSVKTFFFFFGDHIYWDRKTVSVSVKTFFFGDHLNLDRKIDRFTGKIQCHFSGKSLVPPPNPFELLFPCTQASAHNYIKQCCKLNNI